MSDTEAQKHQELSTRRKIETRPKTDLKNNTHSRSHAPSLDSSCLLSARPRPAGGAGAHNGIIHNHTSNSQHRLQCVCIWNWINETQRPLCLTKINPKYGFHNVTFNPNDNTQILSSNENHLLFCSRVQDSLKQTSLNLMKFRDAASRDADAFTSALRSINMSAGSLSRSVFHWKEAEVLTAPAAGVIAIWNPMERFTTKQRLPPKNQAAGRTDHRSGCNRQLFPNCRHSRSRQVLR